MTESNVPKINIMISSTRSDLSEYRKKAWDIIKKVTRENEKKVALVVINMEKEVQRGDRESALTVSKRWVKESDWVMVIVGFNYGTISDEEGADGLSFTEWEYQHAGDRGKKRFVFIAGAPGSGEEEYRVLKEEKVDLKNWLYNPEKVGKEKIEAFRKELSKDHLEIFQNINVFCERFEKTLRIAIDKHINPPEHEPEDFFKGEPPSEEITGLILEMMPDIRDCLQKVMLITNCKKVHDILHDIRQHAIRPLREEVLSHWLQEGVLSSSRKKEIQSSTKRATRLMGRIENVMESFSSEIGPEHKNLCIGVSRVKDDFDKWDEELDSSLSLMSVGEFAENLDRFAEAVQYAFSEADGSMTKEEGELRERYLVLRERLKRARRQRVLSQTDHKRLNRELDKVDANRSGVKNSLIIHHKWQKIHDKLHELDGFRDTRKFDNRLEHFSRTWATKLHDLIDIEINSDQARKANATAVQTNSLKITQEPPKECRNMSGDLKCLKKWLDALDKEKSIGTFDKLCKPFDDAFYCIDKKTLEEVEGAQRRVDELRIVLDDFAAQHRQKTEFSTTGRRN